MSDISIAEAEIHLKVHLPPWVLDLAIIIDRIDNEVAILRAPFSPRLNRHGGTICGQAIMTLADTAMIFAIAGCLGEFKPMTTVSQTSSFLRPAAEADLVAKAHIIKPGRTIMYGEVNLFAGDMNKPIAHATSSYMML